MKKFRSLDYVKPPKNLAPPQRNFPKSTPGYMSITKSNTLSAATFLCFDEI